MTATGIAVDTPLKNLTLTSLSADHPVLTATIRNWLDQEQVHKAIMRLFPPDLAGELGRQRAEAGILYRLEQSPAGHPRVLLQHRSPLRADITGTQSLALQPLLANLRPGTAVRFRIDLNAVVVEHRTHRRAPIVNTRLITGQPLPDDLVGIDVRDDNGTTVLDRLTPHVRGKLADALTEIVVPAEPVVTVRRIGRTPLHTVRYDGQATIIDPDRLHHRLANGIGRAKAYGCGLLSLAPARATR